MSDEEKAEVHGKNRVEKRIKDALDARDKAIADRDAFMKESQAKIDAIQAEANQWKNKFEEQSKIETDWAAKIAERDNQIQTLNSDHSETLACMKRGIQDDEGIGVARLIYSQIQGEKPAFGEWLNGENIPRAVSAYIPKPTTAAAPEPETSSAPVTTPAVPANAGVSNTTNAPSYDAHSLLQQVHTDQAKWSEVRHHFISDTGSLKR